MVVFILDMPKINTWNGHWSGEDDVYAKAYQNREVPKEVLNKEFSYNFGDGWTARVKVKQMPATESRKIMAKSKGFCGYEWMIRSIISRGYIATK